MMMNFEVNMVRSSQRSFIYFMKCTLTVRPQIMVVVDWVRPHPQSALEAPCRQRSRNQPLQQSMPSCSLEAGNLIMAVVIYSSHGSYLAPAVLMGGERGGRERERLSQISGKKTEK